MPRLLPAFLLIISLTTQQACNTRQQANDKSADSATTQSASDSTPGDASGAITDRLTNLGLTPDSHWRGISLGDDFVKIKEVEKGEAFENDAQHVGYTVEFENLESMDVLYYRQNDKVSALHVDLFLNNRSSVDSYSKDLSAYFSSRYGAPKNANGSIVWSGPTREQVTLTDVSKGKDFGLKIRITPVTGTATASAR